MKSDSGVLIKQFWRRSVYGAAGLSLLFGSLTVAALAGDGLAAVPQAHAQSNQAQDVDIRNLSFSPATLTVVRGTTVTWTNHDNTTHTVTADNSTDPGPRSGQVQSGGTYRYTFNQLGSYPYHCQIHPDMKGTVVVVDVGGTDAARAWHTAAIQAESSQATQTVSQSTQINVQSTQTQQIQSHSVTSTTSNGQAAIVASSESQPAPPPPTETTPPPTESSPPPTETSPPPTSVPETPEANPPSTSTPPPATTLETPPEGGRGGGGVEVAQAETPTTTPTTTSELPVGGSGGGETTPPVGGMGAGELSATGPVEAGQRAADAVVSWPTAAFGSLLLAASGGLLAAHRRLTLGRR